ncbi:hypothetical protein KBA27_03605 [bacterium]|nr:hypothetical protein [bacterium]
MNINFSKKNIKVILLIVALVATTSSSQASIFSKFSKNKDKKPKVKNTVERDMYGQKVISDTNIAKEKKEQAKLQLLKDKQRDLKNAVSKEDKQKIQEELDNLNSYTDSYFVTVHKQKVDKRIKTEAMTVNQMSNDGEVDNSDGKTPGPVKRLRLKLKNKDLKNSKSQVSQDTTATTSATLASQAILNCDVMNYYADKSELLADGNASLYFPKNKSTLKADHIIYNQDSNHIKANGHVVINKEGHDLFGDSIDIDMNEENALMDNPETQMLQVVSHAKKGYMYGDKIIQENGQLFVNRHTDIKFRTDTFGPDLFQMMIGEKDKSFFSKDTETFRIDTKDLIINSKASHDTVSLKHATVYFHEKKLFTIPSITIHSNKAHDYVEADYPELGSMTNLGSYIGPGFDFDTPRGTNLKLVPFLNYHGHSNGSLSDDKQWGWGGLVKYKSATNITQAAFGTADKIWVIRGKQRLDDHLYLQYGTNSYLDEGPLGFRMPKVGVDLVYKDSYSIPKTLGANRDFTYDQRITAGYFQDYLGNPKSFWADGAGIGTTRFRYAGTAAQTLYNYKNEDKLFSATLSLVGFGASTVYGTGATQNIVRIGPALHTQYKYWMQDVGYFLSGFSDESPFVFDKYVYGRSNVYARETLRLCKYLTASWFVSLNLSNDSWDGKTFQEDSFFISLGPDDIKLNFGYDTIRQQTFLTLAVALDAKGSQINYKKMTVINPDTLGKKGDKDKDLDNSQSKRNDGGFFVQDDTPVLEKAEVIDINPHAKEEL